MKAYIGDYEISINGHPYKGTIRLGEDTFVEAYFFDGRLNPTSPLRAYMIFRFPGTDRVIVQRGSNEIEDLFSALTAISDVPEDELKTKYCQILLDYVTQNNLEMDLSSKEGNSIYVEDLIVRSLYNPETKKRAK